MKNQRRGFTLIEIVVAASLLAAILATSVQMLRVLSDHQRTVAHSGVALVALQTLAERICNLPWNELTQETAQTVAIPEPIARRLPGAKFNVHVVDETTPVVSKRIAIELSWLNLNGERGVPARLTAWAFPDPHAN
jgi:prepilin-type N-terminal cleavage/methylation domain-containing protein